MLRIFFKAIAYLFHPLLLPTYATLILVYANPYAFASVEGGGYSILKIIFPLTFGYPVFTVVLMKALNFVDDIHLPDQKQRFMPYIAVMIFYIWTFLVVRKYQMPDEICWMMLGSTLAVVLAFVANAFFKISIHTVGAACLVAVAISAAANALMPLIGMSVMAIIVAGLVGSCRLFLNAHQKDEVYMGYAVGFMGMMAASWFV
jgi:hypothetical protein